MIAENEVDRVFDAGAIAKLATAIKAPPNATTRLGDNVRAAAHAYFAERARTHWKAIGKQIADLHSAVDTADRDGDSAAARLAYRINSTDQATRNWLERCARREIRFPLPDEIVNRQTRKQAIGRLRSILSYGREPVKGRNRPSGKRSRTTFQSRLRVPQSLRGRPRDLAARELVQQLALAYTDATGRSPPRRVNLGSAGPFFRFVKRCFELLRISSGGVVDLINEREIRRKQLERLHSWRSKHYSLSEK